MFLLITYDKDTLYIAKTERCVSSLKKCAGYGLKLFYNWKISQVRHTLSQNGLWYLILLINTSYTYCRVSHVNSVRESSSEHQGKHVEWNQVDEKHIASPGGNLKYDTPIYNNE